MAVKAAVWIRVSSERQHEENQIPDIERFCAHHGYDIVKRYELNDASAYKGEHQAMRTAMLDDAYRGEFTVLVIWAIDRISREGIEDLLRLIRQLRERHAGLVSIQEPWLNGTDATTELLAALSAWNAQEESRRKSERIRAGLARRKRDLAAGREVPGRQSVGGRKPGSKDRKPRERVTGEAKGWSAERRERLAAANRQRAAARKAEAGEAQ